METTRPPTTDDSPARVVSGLLLHYGQRPIAYYPTYSDLAGSTAGGVLLSQLLYWWSAQGGARFYKTDEELRRETHVTVRELRAAKERLRAAPFLTITREGVPAKTWYAVDPVALAQAILNLAPVPTSLHDGVQTGWHDAVQTGLYNGVQTITEITAETTSEEVLRTSLHDASGDCAGSVRICGPMPEAVKTLLKKRREPAPIDEDDFPGLVELITDYNLPLDQLNDNAWWQNVWTLCNNPAPTWVQMQFAAMENWLIENPAKKPTTGWKRFVRGWLTRNYERGRRGHA